MNSKKGFGLLEVMAAAVVLGFLVVALTRLQLGNREAILRIRTRDAAQIVAQEFIDSISKVGLSSITAESFPNPGEDSITRTFTWKGKPNSRMADSIVSQTTYTIIPVIEDSIGSHETSNLTRANNADTTHIRTKTIHLTVRWPYKNSTQSISLSRIIK